MDTMSLSSYMEDEDDEDDDDDDRESAISPSSLSRLTSSDGSVYIL